ncbi:DUF1825 family protein [Alkalinema sp. FACHB-956]|uniref:DUF1825 family protein n=1 Tax=Alkalinema sp. FACHB-956 TaxID=2692768 RepID=UPI001689C951|nr:DUF1825 family protein [Alkalinema sp. FACHB-956]MBD2329729.1 DUF1825 family protein [Alkalinema sp. FACHB-956]
MSFFESEIVQQEAKDVFQTYQSLIELGSHYGKFDRDGKIKYIEQMEEVMDRFKIMMKRLELSDDFSARMTIEQLKTQLGQFGMTPQQMFDNMRITLDRMKAQIGP